MKKWVCVAALLAAGTVRADYVGFQGSFSPTWWGPRSTVAAAVAGGEFWGSIDTSGAASPAQGATVAAVDYSFTLYTLSHDVYFTASGAVGGGVTAGVESVALGTGGYGTEIRIDGLAIAGDTVALVLLFDPSYPGYAGTAALLPGSPGAPPALFDTYGGSTSGLGIAAVGTGLPLAPAPSGGPSAPEPASLALLGCGCLAWAVARVRRKPGQEETAAPGNAGESA